MSLLKTVGLATRTAIVESLNGNTTDCAPAGEERHVRRKPLAERSGLSEHLGGTGGVHDAHGHGEHPSFQRRARYLGNG